MLVVDVTPAALKVEPCIVHCPVLGNLQDGTCGQVPRLTASGLESELSGDDELCKGCGAIPALRSWKEA